MSPPRTDRVLQIATERGELQRCQRGQIYEIDPPAHLQWKFRRVGERRLTTHVTENTDLIEYSRLCALSSRSE